MTRSGFGILLTAACLGMAAGLCGCGVESTETISEPPPETTLAGTVIAAGDVTGLAMPGCATCGSEKTDGASFLELDGRQYAFCCPGCMEIFRKDPARFIGEGEEHAHEGDRPHEGEHAREGDSAHDDSGEHEHDGEHGAEGGSGE